MRRIRELPVEEAALWIGCRPEIFFQNCHRCIRLEKRLRVICVERIFSWEPILLVGEDRLKYRKLVAIVVPSCLAHDLSQPLTVDWPEDDIHSFQ